MISLNTLRSRLAQIGDLRHDGAVRRMHCIDPVRPIFGDDL